MSVRTESVNITSVILCSQCNITPTMHAALYPRHILPKTPQSDISLAVGCPQSMIDMMIPKLVSSANLSLTAALCISPLYYIIQHLLCVDSDSGSETSDVPPRPQRRSVGIQTECE